jgi:hypothetical protein
MTDAAVSSAIGTAPVGCDGDRNHAVARHSRTARSGRLGTWGNTRFFIFAVAFARAISTARVAAKIGGKRAPLNRTLRVPSSHSELRGTVLLNCEELFWQCPIESPLN